MGDLVIDFQNVSFRYMNASGGGVRNVNLHIPRGQVVLLTGPSGCGKSTILRLVSGLAPHFYDGTIDGKVSACHMEPGETPLHKTVAVVGSVFQNPRTQFYNVDTTGELAFTCENQGMDANEILRRIEKTVERFHIEDLMDRNIFHLSGGQKQQIACASVDVAEPEIFLLDEPTANLDYEAAHKLREMIAVWKKSGKTILIAEHRIAWIWELCDRVLVMREGCIEEDLDRQKMNSISSGDLIRRKLRKKEDRNPLEFLSSGFDGKKYRDCATENGEGKGKEIRIRELSYAYDKKMPVLDHAEISIPSGKITAIVGENGAGKSTFLHCISGIIRKCRAKIEVDGRNVTIRELRKKTFLVMQDVNHQLFTESVLDEVLISMEEEDRGKALEVLRSLNLRELAQRHPMSLSGGEK